MNNYFHPGEFDIYTGPMKSGKSKAMMDHLDKISYMDNISYIILKPDVDTRSEGIMSRYGNMQMHAHTISAKNPTRALGAIHKYEPNAKVVAIDELQFFDEGIEWLVNMLLLQNRHVIGAGLNQDFRGEPFGSMPYLLAKADTITSCYGICEYNGCNNRSTRTQRLINGEPAKYDSPITIVDGSGKEEYQTRCAEHHYVPK